MSLFLAMEAEGSGHKASAPAWLNEGGAALLSSLISPPLCQSPKKQQLNYSIEVEREFFEEILILSLI